MPRVRLSDVASAAGVSAATASLVLRGRPGPSARTREAVNTAAESLGYRPDRTARQLASRRSGLVGVVADVASPFHAELVDELDGATSQHDIDLVLGVITSRRGESHVVENLLDSRVEALVLLGSGLSAAELEEIGRSIPTIVIGRGGTRTTVGVRVAEQRGMAAAVDHLVLGGHRRICYIDGPRGEIAAARRRGYRAAMRRHGLAAEIDIRPGGAAEGDVAVTADTLVEQLRGANQAPSAVVTFNDRVAIGIRDTVLRAGLGVPGDLAMVGYDDSLLARLATVDLTSVSQQPAALARAAVDALPDIDSLLGETRIIPPRLVIRSSSGGPAAR